MKTRFAALLFCVLFGLAACGAPDAPAAAQPERALRDTVLYYADENGLMVPVVRAIPWEEGIGKAALRCLVDSEANRTFAASCGLVPTLPEGTQIDLRIVEGEARVDLAGMEAPVSAAAERNLVTSVVNTMMEFPTVDSVRILIDGKEAKALPNGTDVSAAFGRLPLNAETAPVAANSGEGAAVTLYFPNYESSLVVPVERAVEGEVTLAGTLNELLKGPAQTDALRACFPEGTRLLSVTAEGGVAKIELSAEAENLLEHPKLSERAQECAALVCAQFGVPAAVLQVNGTPLFEAGPVMAKNGANDLTQG